MATILGGVAEKEEHEWAKDRINILSKVMFRLKLYFTWYLFQRLPVFYVYKTESIAYVDGYGIYVSKKFLELPNEEQLLILRHELYHIAFQHSLQLARKFSKAATTYEKNIVKITHNVISDAVVNGLIKKEDEALGIKSPLENYVDPDKVSEVIEADVVKLGFVDALEKLMYMVKKGDITINVVTATGQPVDIVNNDINALLRTHKILYAVLENKNNNSTYKIRLILDSKPSTSGCGGTGGKEELDQQDESKNYKKIKNAIGGSAPKTPEDVYKLVKDAVDFDKFKKTISGMKMAGTGRSPAIDYELERVAAKKPEWESVLVSTLTSFMSRYAVVSWHFMNRRAPLEKPGIRYMSVPDVHILLDVSGSMLDGTLDRALERVVYVAENYPDTKIMLYQWSDGAPPPERIDRKFAENIRKYRKLKVESGGTVIEPALDLVLKGVEKKDAVVILTDGAIFDIDSPSVIEKFKKLTQKAGVVIFASLGYIPEKLPPQVMKIRLED